MKNQAYNPYLPSWEYVPDGEPHVFGDRLYVYGSHDKFNGTQFCMNDYVCWSAPLDDLSDWKLEGTIYRKEQDPHAKVDSIMQAPDVVRGYDGRYYLYYALGLMPFVCVAVADEPAGPFAYYGVVHWKNGTVVGLGEKDVFMFDPGLFMDDGGECYLYCGFAPEEDGTFGAVCQKYQMEGAYAFRLEKDMLTIKAEGGLILPKAGHSAGTGFEGHEFYEAGSMRKIGGKYYFIYSSFAQHELCYATSDYPDKGFRFGGVIVSIGDIGYRGRTERLNYTGNTHGGLVCVNGQWHIFYHRQTNRHNYSRQACAEAVAVAEDGTIAQVEITSCGLNGKALAGKGAYPAYIACNLMSKSGALHYGTANTPEAEGHPYFTQTGEDREENGDQYIADMRDGALAGFKYFEFVGKTKIGVEVSGHGEGVMEVWTKLEEARGMETHGMEVHSMEAARRKPICKIVLRVEGEKRTFEGEEVELQGKWPLYFVYRGSGGIDFHGFRLQ